MSAWHLGAPALWSLGWRSLLNRRASALLTVLAIALSVTLLLGVERLRGEVRASFVNTISGVDLIVGARTGELQLLLYSVFRLGAATNELSWRSYQEIAALPQVAWAVPIALGDSHRSFPVVGTTAAYFEHFRYGRGQHLALASGRRFSALYDVVLGADVAAGLGYRLGDRLVLAHGTGPVTLYQHSDQPFRVVGILAPTGTPVDRSLHVSLAAITAIHRGWQGGVPPRPGSAPLPPPSAVDLQPQTITAALLGLHSRGGVFRVQRVVNTYRAEPLLAILPGVALAQLWRLLDGAEQVLRLIAMAVVMLGLCGMLAVLLVGLDGRRRELAILRVLGASPTQLFALIIGEALLLTLAGAVLGLALLYGGFWLARPWLTGHLGLLLEFGAPTPRDWLLLGVLLAAGALSGLLPAWRACRRALADGLSLRL